MALDEQTREEHKTTNEVAVAVKYLPSPDTFEQTFARSATLGEVRTTAMTFFKMKDFQDRDNHTFHLVNKDQQRDDLETTLNTLLDKEHEDKAKFQLVEVIKAG